MANSCRSRGRRGVGPEVVGRRTGALASLPIYVTARLLRRRVTSDGASELEKCQKPQRAQFLSRRYGTCPLSTPRPTPRSASASALKAPRRPVGRSRGCVQTIHADGYVTVCVRRIGAGGHPRVCASKMMSPLWISFSRSSLQSSVSISKAYRTLKCVAHLYLPPFNGYLRCISRNASEKKYKEASKLGVVKRARR